MYSNPNIKCPECGAWNKAENWQCWKCKNEGRVTELSEVGGASAPWAERKTVYGGKLHAGVGASTYWRNPASEQYLDSLRLIADYARKIYNHIPSGKGLMDWMEHFLAITATDLSAVAHDLRYEEPNTAKNPGHKYMARANARLIENYANEIMGNVGTADLEDWMKSKISSASNRMDDVWHALEMRGNMALSSRRNPVNTNTLIDPVVGLKLAENIFSNNPDKVELVEEPSIGDNMDDDMEFDMDFEDVEMRRNPDEEMEMELEDVEMQGTPYRRNARLWAADGKWRHNPQAPVWGGPLFRKHRYRRNAQAPVWGGPLFRNRYRRNSPPAWGGPLFRKNPQKPVWGGPLFRRNKLSRYRRNSPPAWGGPLFRRNAQAPVWGGPLFRKNRLNRYRRNSPPAWGGPLFRKNKLSRYRRNSPPAWGGPLFRRNPQKPVWGGPLFRKNRLSRYRRNAQSPVWGGPLFRRNPSCAACGDGCDDPSLCGCSTEKRYNPSALARTAKWAPCAACGKATCGCGCAGDATLCVCSGTSTYAGNPDLYDISEEILYGGGNYRRNS